MDKLTVNQLMMLLAIHIGQSPKFVWMSDREFSSDIDCLKKYGLVGRTSTKGAFWLTYHGKELAKEYINHQFTSKNINHGIRTD